MGWGEPQQIAASGTAEGLRVYVADQERRIDDLSRRLLDANVGRAQAEDDLTAARERIGELEQIVATQNRRLAQRRSA